MGPARSAVRKRADYVLNTYIKPACEQAGYEALRADQGVGRDICKGTTTALENAPMAVAYMGPTPDSLSGSGGCNWNANVMIEIGYRLASRLPLIFLCDQNSQGELPDLPLILTALNVIPLPPPDPPPDRNSEKDIIDSLVRQFADEERTGRTLVSIHPVAAINAASSKDMSAKNLLYTAASDIANQLFFGNPGLVGRTLDQFYDELQRRMHPAQYRAFKYDQNNARNLLKLRATGEGENPSFASVPIVFEKHENPYFNNRAFLPIIVQDYRTGDGLDWYNLRVLYLNVTTATEKVQDESSGDEYYICHLNPVVDKKLPPLNEYRPIRIFLSYRTENRLNVETVYKLLLDMKPYVSPFMDRSMRGGENWVAALEKNLQDSELCFLFFDDKELGDGQKAEVDAIKKRAYSGKEYPVVPVRLAPAAKLPDGIDNRQSVEFNDLTEAFLRDLLYFWFPRRCSPDWELSGKYRDRIQSTETDRGIYRDRLQSTETDSGIYRDRIQSTETDSGKESTRQGDNGDGEV
jgi:TIR domain